MSTMNNKIITLALLVLSGAGSFYIMYQFPNNDWINIFYKSAQQILLFKSPFDIPSYMNPIWVAIMLTPFTLFTPEISRGMFGIISLSSSVFICYKLNISIKNSLLIILSASVLQGFFQSNIEPVLLLGIFAPASIALVILMSKPQIGVGYFIYQLYWSYKEHRMIKTILPVVVLLILTLPYIPSIIQSGQRVSSLSRNVSLFPYSIIPGIILLAIAIYKKQPLLTICSSILLSPYAALYTYTGIQLSIAVYGGKYKTPLLITMLILTWINEILI